jgi:hypothetical protein
MSRGLALPGFFSHVLRSTGTRSRKSRQTGSLVDDNRGDARGQRRGDNYWLDEAAGACQRGKRLYRVQHGGGGSSTWSCGRVVWCSTSRWRHDLSKVKSAVDFSGIRSRPA